MGKARQNNKKRDVKRRQMIQEVFKKGKKQREIAKKFDDKIAQKQGTKKNREKFQAMKQQKKKENNSNRDQVFELNKKFDEIRSKRGPGASLL